MNDAAHWQLLMALQPLAWLALLVAVYFSSDRRARQLKRGAFAVPKGEGALLNHRLFGMLIAAKLVAWGGNVLVGGVAGDGRWYSLAGHALAWAAFVGVVVCSVAILGEVLRDALEPVPRLIEPAHFLLRWVAGLVLAVVLLADLPLIRIDQFTAWLADARLSLALCVFAFEAGLLVVLAMNLRKLGLFVLRRSVGVALGLALLGASDLLRAVALALPGSTQPALLNVSAAIVALAVATWAFFILTADRPRLPHALNPSGLLRTWHELTPQLASNLRVVEKTPFIAGIEAQVRVVLAKYGVKQGLQ